MKHFGLFLFLAFIMLITGCSSVPHGNPTSKDGLTNQNDSSKEENKVSAGNPEKAWWDKNTNQIQSLTSTDYSDLTFLNEVLKNKQYVFLGESVHGVAEYSEAKVRLIKYLHENLGFDVVAFESGLGDIAVTTAQMDSADFNSNTFMKQTITPVWTSVETRPLFDYILDSQNKDPLLLTGFDMQTMNTFGQFMINWIEKVDPEYADFFSKLELSWNQKTNSITNGQSLTDQELKQIESGYNQAISFVTKHSDTLNTTYGIEFHLEEMIIKTLQERIEFMEKYQKIAGTRNAEALTEARDAIMAENIEWLTNKIYPGKKIIFWGHNTHIRNHNTDIYYKDIGQTNFKKWDAKSMFQDLPDDLKNKSYTIGFYMHDGVFSFNREKLYQVNDGKPFSKDYLEYILNQSKNEYTFINVEGHIPSKDNEWMDRPIYALSQGLVPEKLTVSNTYDGIFFIKHVLSQNYLNSGN
jgi:erythromycin esterase